MRFVFQFNINLKTTRPFIYIASNHVIVTRYMYIFVNSRTNLRVNSTQNMHTHKT